MVFVPRGGQDYGRLSSVVEEAAAHPGEPAPADPTDVVAEGSPGPAASVQSSPGKAGGGGGEEPGSSPEREGGGRTSGSGEYLPEFQQLTDAQCQRELEQALARGAELAPPVDPAMQPVLVRCVARAGAARGKPSQHAAALHRDLATAGAEAIAH